MAASDAAAAPQAQPGVAPLAIWVVDDDPMALTAVRLLLEQQGHRAKGFADPRRLLTALRQGELPELILADLYMPEMTGIEVIEQVREEFGELPVTIMTSSRDLDGSVTAINKGAFGYLLKPIVPEQLGWLIGRLQRERALKESVAAEQARLAHAQRLAKLGTLASGIAHEINNPNCFVLGNIDVLEKLWKKLEPELGELNGSEHPAIKFAREEMPGILRELRGGSNRIANIVRSLATYSRRDSDSQPHSRLTVAIEDAALVLRNKLSVLEFKVEDETRGHAFVAVSSTDLEQMLVNLLSNAADATAGFANPAVTVRIGRPAEGRLRVDVVDNGAGIDPERAHLLETPFFTTKEPGSGTGLGLYITRQLVNHVGGTLAFGNNPGPGATFSLTLPAVAE